MLHLKHSSADEEERKRHVISYLQDRAAVTHKLLSKASGIKHQWIDKLSSEETSKTP
jgi:hypothetical protein